MNPELRSLSKTDRSNDEHSAAEALLRTHLDGDCDCSNPFAVLGDDYDFGQAMAAFKQMEEDSVAFVQKASTTYNLNQTRSPLLRLPPELREEIWKSAIDDNDDSNLDTDIGRTCRFTYRQDAVRTYRSTMEKHFEPWMTEENYRNVWTWEHDFSLLSSKVQSLFFKTTACAIHVNALVLFFVSRQVRDEASKVLFECFTFDIGFLIFRTDGYANAPPGPFAWGKGFVANFRLIQKLQIYTNGYHCLHSSSVEKLCDYFPGLKYLRLRVRIMDKADPDTDRRLTTRVIESIRTVSGTFPELVPTAYENECGVVVEYCRGGKAKKGGKQLERWIEQQLQRISR